MTTTTPYLSETAIRALFEQQLAKAPRVALTTARQRLEKIKKIEGWIENETNVRALSEAMHKDFRKSSFEVWATEIGIVKQAIVAVRRNLRHWMQDEPVDGSLALAGMSSWIRYEAKGACLIIAPWNYPFNLAIMPLVYAIAAGNTVILKPSELTPHTSALIAAMLGELFPAEEVAVVEGDADTAQALLQLSFHHIFFTGSPAVGKIVMAAAARHLSSVTLELGGKSPVVLDETADIPYHAEKLVWAKLMNNGQTCIAPDYVLVHASKQDQLLAELKKALQKLYGADPRQSPDLARVVNDRNFQRLRRLLDDAVSKGARVAIGGNMVEAERYIAPTVLTGLNDEMDIQHEEIFGPILPVIPFQNREEALAFIRSRPKPLDMYIGSRSQVNIRYFLENTSAGSTVINEYMTSFSNTNLPFGGVNNSGLGKSLGVHSFREFSNARGLMRRHWLFAGLSMIQPPFSDVKMKLLKFFYKLV